MIKFLFIVAIFFISCNSSTNQFNIKDSINAANKKQAEKKTEEFEIKIQDSITLARKNLQKEYDSLIKFIKVDKDEFSDLITYSSKLNNEFYPNKKTLTAKCYSNGDISLISHYFSTDWLKSQLIQKQIILNGSK